MITFDDCCLKMGTGTCSVTPGTRTNVAHGLGYAPTLKAIQIQPLGVVGDSDDAGAVNLVAVDATNFVVKSNKASQAFQWFIMLDRDTGGRNAFV